MTSSYRSSSRIYAWIGSDNGVEAEVEFPGYLYQRLVIVDAILLHLAHNAAHNAAGGAQGGGACGNSGKSAEEKCR